jgi:hypothetical protein
MRKNPLYYSKGTVLRMSASVQGKDSGVGHTVVRGADLFGVGDAVPDPAEAVRFLRAWHADALTGRASGDGLLALTPLRGTGFAGASVFAAPDLMCRTIEGAGLEPLTWDRKGVPCNLYMAACELSGVPDLSARPWSRGRRQDMGWAPGLWADLDVGSGKFASATDALDALRMCWRVGLGPSLIVETGSGGLHPYWIVDGGLEPKTAEAMSARLRVWLMDQVGVHLDNVTNCDRILRLPGSLRFPKAGESLGVTSCRMVWSDDRRLDAGRLVAVTQATWETSQKHRARVSMSVQDERDRIEGLLAGWSGSDSFWGQQLNRVHLLEVEQAFARTHTWESVLEPHGWTLLDGDGRPDSVGRRTWTRPGLDETVEADAVGMRPNLRSALTDWIEGPDVMTLKSDAPETGLLRLKRLAEDDPSVRLTKLLVWVELAWGGDLTAYVRAVRDGRG